MDLSLYKNVPYVDGGRIVSDDPAKNGLDCFGLARHALHHVFNGPLLESFSGIFRTDAVSMTNGFHRSSAQFEQCAPQPGALACCFHKSITGNDVHYVFHHVGICIDGANVMHTSSKNGYAVLPLRVFKRLAHKVEFYRYVKNKSEK